MKSSLEISLQTPNVKAFLEMIRHSEGTAVPNGYRMMFGGKLFPMAEKTEQGEGGVPIVVEVWPDHPHIFFAYKNKAGQVIKTSAMGAYQITYTTWVPIQKRLGLEDFSPANQDLAAAVLLSDAGALSLVVTGNFPAAIEKVRHIWASLPGAGCNQPEHTLAEVEKWYEDAGGTRLAA